MRARSRALRAHAFEQRLATLLEVLECDGEVASVDDVVSRTARRIRIEVEAPGYDLPREATYEYEEWYRRTARGWLMTDYQYEIRSAPAGGWRKAYHWHDGAYHFHCHDPTDPRSYEHYRGYEVDLLADARPDLVAIHARGHVDCSGLTPVRR